MENFNDYAVFGAILITMIIEFLIEKSVLKSNSTIGLIITILKSISGKLIK